MKWTDVGRSKNSSDLHLQGFLQNVRVRTLIEIGAGIELCKRTETAVTNDVVVSNTKPDGQHLEKRRSGAFHLTTVQNRAFGKDDSAD